MKHIAQILIPITILLGLASCSKTDIQQFIYAGISSGDYITYYENDPPESLAFEYPSSGSSYSIDIDEDGEDDITFGFVGSASPGHSSFSMKVTAAEETEICTGTATGLAAQLEEGVIIDENRTWGSGEHTMHSYSYMTGETASLTGDWVNQGLYYIGFRKENRKQHQYGWVEINMEAGSSWFINSYAFITK